MGRVLLLMLVVLAAAVGLAACGGDDGGEATTEPAAAEVTAEAEELADIVDTAVAAGDFTTLAAALEAAGLVETLKGEGPFTVFAPTDAAFAALPEGTVDDLLLEENRDQLTGILTFHVVDGAVLSSDLSDGQAVTTLEGGELTIAIAEDGTVTVNGATVTTADIETSNGVIHVIDAVLLP